MVNRFIYRLKEKALNKRIDLSAREVEYRSLENISSCLVMSEADKAGKEAIAALEKRLKDVCVYKLYFDKGNSDFPEDEHTVFVHNKDLGFGGKIKNPCYHRLLEQKFDILVDFTADDSALIRYTQAKAGASFIAGMKKKEGLADLVVEPVEDRMDFIEKLVNILAHLKKY